MRGPRRGAVQRATSGDGRRPSSSPMQPMDYSASIIPTANRRDSDVSSFAAAAPPPSATAPPTPPPPPPPIELPPCAPLTPISLFYLLPFTSNLHSPLHATSQKLLVVFSLVSALITPSQISHAIFLLFSPLSNVQSNSANRLSKPHPPPTLGRPFSLFFTGSCSSLSLTITLYLPPASPRLYDCDINRYLTLAYSLFLAGDDCSIVDLDAEYIDRLKRHATTAAKEIEALEADVAQLEAKLLHLAAAPSRLEELKAERAALKEDINKFQNVVEKFSGMIEEKRDKLVERERELEGREMEKKMLDEENEELKRRIREQSVSSRDMERMMRELQAVERDIAEGESRRNEMEEKAWALNSELERKFREIEALAEQCNQAIRKLKIGNNFQHVLNAKASSAAEVIGTNYKIKLKPALNSLLEEAKKSKVSKVEELIILLKQSLENDIMIDGKRAHCTAIQTKINEVESQVEMLKKEIEDHSLKCSSEIEKIEEELMAKEEQAKIMERDAQKLLMESGENLKKAFIESNEETRFCAQELYTLIDSVSQYKEFIGFSIVGIREEIREIAEEVKQAFDKVPLLPDWLAGFPLTGPKPYTSEKNSIKQQCAAIILFHLICCPPNYFLGAGWVRKYPYQFTPFHTLLTPHPAQFVKLCTAAMGSRPPQKLKDKSQVCLRCIEDRQGGKIYMNKDFLKDHCKIQHPTYKHFCFECGNVFWDKRHLKEHKKDCCK